MVKSKYSQKEFEKDLNELEKLLKIGGSKNNQENFNDQDDEEDEDEEQYGGYEYNDEDDEDDEDEDNEEENEYYKLEGGKKKNSEGPLRHFKLIEVNGKEASSSARPSLKTHQSPVSAAKKLLSSITKDLSESEKLKSKTIFKMKETTRTSGKRKVYGPYIGTYIKYKEPVVFTPKNKPGASPITIKFKQVVKLYKGEQKGGLKR